jgi:hypothetical protein
MSDMGDRVSNLRSVNILRFYTTVTQGGGEQGDTSDSLGGRRIGLWSVTHVTLLGDGLGDSREKFLSRMVIRDG